MLGVSYTPAGVTETSTGQRVPGGDLIPHFTQVLLHLHSLYLRKPFFSVETEVKLKYSYTHFLQLNQVSKRVELYAITPRQLFPSP